MSMTAVSNFSNYIPARKLKANPYTVRVDDVELDLIESMADLNNASRAEYTRIAALIGMYIMAKSQRRFDVAESIRRKLLEQAIEPKAHISLAYQSDEPKE
ncbi:hypothetical protein [Hahella ganghwensis]|uniref:hypothetical protein n=1 Tax=Hahella ganghwensis TaxID=286420 RepID=UPI000378ABA4|nr:hypothetical protein [Hahella ganghwensis]